MINKCRGVRLSVLLALLFHELPAQLVSHHINFSCDSVEHVTVIHKKPFRLTAVDMELLESAIKHIIS